MGFFFRSGLPFLPSFLEEIESVWVLVDTGLEDGMSGERLG